MHLRWLNSPPEHLRKPFAEDNSAEDMNIHLSTSYGIPQQTKELLDPDTVTFY